MLDSTFILLNYIKFYLSSLNVFNHFFLCKENRFFLIFFFFCFFFFQICLGFLYKNGYIFLIEMYYNIVCLFVVDSRNILPPGARQIPIAT